MTRAPDSLSPMPLVLLYKIAPAGEIKAKLFRFTRN